MGHSCPEPDCPGVCCNFEAAAMIPMVTSFEWQVIQDYLQDKSLELPPLQGLECPFFLNNRCLIYPVRPIGCRAFFCNLSNLDFRGILPWLEKVKEIGDYPGTEVKPILDWFYDEY
jgi:Fe-S-cluster containining protein